MVIASSQADLLSRQIVTFFVKEIPGSFTIYMYIELYQSHLDICLLINW